jgi:hypothetical protein
MSYPFKNLGKLLLFGLCFWQLSGTKACATVPQCRGYVIVAESAGAQLYLADNLASLIHQAGLPLNVETTDWSTLSVTTDYESKYNFTVKSQKLAKRVMDLRRTCPNAPIYLIGNGCGTTVVVKAAEQLPPNTVQRVILLGPTLSCTYDLRRTMLASTEGIDTFACKQDLTLELANQYRGTTDRGPGTSCAGLTGFMPRVMTAADASLYATKLRQCAVKDPAEGSEGSLCHLRYISNSFLRMRIVPILDSSMRMKPICPPTPQPPTLPAPQYPTPQTPAPQYPTPPAPPYPTPPTKQLPSPTPMPYTPPAGTQPAPSTPMPMMPGMRNTSPQLPPPAVSLQS